MALSSIDTDEFTRRLGRDRRILNAAKTKLVPFNSIHRDDLRKLFMASLLRGYKNLRFAGIPRKTSVLL